MSWLLANLESILLAVFGVSALVGGVLVIALRQPMRVAMALISTMIFLGGIYGLLGVHFIAAFQVLIYVGAVMVFMVYVIMLLDPRDPATRRRFSPLVIPGAAVALVVAALLVRAVAQETTHAASTAVAESFSLADFAAAFLNEYWLHFELTSVLLLAAVVAAIAVIRVNRRSEHG